MKTQTRLALAVCLFLLVLLVQVGGWLVAGSLGLLADSLHTGTDLVSLVLASLALWASEWPVTPKYTYGFHRSSVLVRLFNSATLILLLLYVLGSALFRILAPHPVSGPLMAGAAALSLALNGATVLVLRRSASQDPTVRSAYLHVKADMFLTGGVVVSGLAIQKTGWMILDPLTSIVLAGWVVHDAWELLRDSWAILMEAVPSEIDLGEVTRAIRVVPGVADVHHVHVWKVGPDQLICTAHVTLTEDPLVSSTGAIHEEIEQVLWIHFDIAHATVRFEY